MDTNIEVSQAKILLVEDNQAHADLAIEALKDARVLTNIEVVETGEEALSYLSKKANSNKESLPDLILLDLNLPGLDGRDVLMNIKSDPMLKCIPVIVLTTSNSEADLLTSYRRHANCFIKKPVDFDQFHDALIKATDFWFTIAKVPGNGAKFELNKLS